MVVLVILGLAAAVVVPAFGTLQRESVVDSAFAVAKAQAARRGDPLQLALTADGQWRLTAANDTTATAIAQGTDTSGVRGDWLISPAGHCVPLRSAALPTATSVWDPIRCTTVR